MTAATPTGRGREVWYVAVTDFPRGLGSTTRARSMCRALSIAGYTPRLLIPHALGHGSNAERAGESAGLSFEYLNGSAARPPGSTAVALAKLRGNFTLFARMARTRRGLACLMLYNATLFDCWGALLAGRMFGIPTVLDWTDEWFDPAAPVGHFGFTRYALKRFAKATEGLVRAGVRRIIVVSRYLERRLGHHRRKAVFFPVAFDPSSFATAEPVRLAPPGEFAILYAGSVSPIEGIEFLVEGFRSVAASSTGRIRLFIVGAPAHGETIRKYEALAGDLVAEGLVTFIPTVDHHRYASLLRGADLLVIPRPTSTASTAGFPYKLVEYIASGSPVLVTRFGDVGEYFTDGAHCLMCEPDDAAALAEGMRKAMARDARLPEIAAAGRARVTELFSMESVAARLGGMVAGLDGRAS